MNSQKTALVLGGAGFIGKRIVNSLAKQGWRIRVGTRNVNAARQTRIFGDVGQIVTLRAPIQDPTRLRAALRGVDLVVNCVGILAETGAQSFKAVQSDGAIQLAQLAAESGVSDFIQLSSLASDANSASSYARTKAESEAGILSYMPQATILRPSIVFGSEDQFFNRFAAMLRTSPFLPIIGSGLTRFQPVYVDDVANAALTSLVSPDAKGQIYGLGGPGIYTFKELMEFIIATVRRKRSLLHIPESLAAFIAATTSWLPGSPLTTDQLILLKQDTIVDPGLKTLHDLGILPQSIENIVPSYLQQYRPGGRFETEVVKVG